jgi:polyisoprenoid-binding protein YceI
MKRLILPSILAALMSLPAFAAPETYTVDPRHTFPSYEISHFGYSMQRGRFNKASGRITLDTAARKCSADIAIDVASVSSGVDKLDEHLRGEDFFNAAKNPQITFRTENCVFEGDRVKSSTGDLTINGVTRPVTLVANVFQCAPNPMNRTKQCGADFEASIKRSDFGMKYALPALGDDVKLRINVEATQG